MKVPVYAQGHIEAVTIIDIDVQSHYAACGGKEVVVKYTSRFNPTADSPGWYLEKMAPGSVATKNTVDVTLVAVKSPSGYVFVIGMVDSAAHAMRMAASVLPGQHEYAKKMAGGEWQAETESETVMGMDYGGLKEAYRGDWKSANVTGMFRSDMPHQAKTLDDLAGLRFALVDEISAGMFHNGLTPAVEQYLRSKHIAATYDIASFSILLTDLHGKTRRIHQSEIIKAKQQVRPSFPQII